MQNLYSLFYNLLHLAQIDGAHTLGATSVSWAPAAPKGSLLSAKGPGAPVKRFVSGGCDNTIRVRAPSFLPPPLSALALVPALIYACINPRLAPQSR